jgi:hypothetical protein
VIRWPCILKVMLFNVVMIMYKIIYIHIYICDLPWLRRINQLYAQLVLYHASYKLLSILGMPWHWLVHKATCYTALVLTVMCITYDE